jgi:hypothetical protein
LESTRLRSFAAFAVAALGSSNSRTTVQLSPLDPVYARTTVARSAFTLADLICAAAGCSGARTVIWNDALALRPPESVAVQLTVVVPIGKVDPDGGVQVTGTVPSTCRSPSRRR